MKITPFTHIEPSVFTEQQETQTPQQPTSTGIARSPDAYETFQVSEFDFLAANPPDPAIVQQNPPTRPSPDSDRVAFSDLRQVLEAAKGENKQVLTANTFNAFLSKNANQYREIAKNLRNVIPENFYLTPAQKKVLDALSDHDIQQIQNAVQQATETNSSIEINFSPDDESGRIKITNGDDRNPLIQIADGSCNEALKNLSAQLEQAGIPESLLKSKNYGMDR